MAPDIEITCESSRVDVILHGFKTLVLQSATLLTLYKLLRGQYASIDLGCSRGQMVQKLEVVKQLFPCETAFNSPDTETGGSEETNFQALVPHVGFGRILGLRCSQPGNPFDANRNLLGLFRLDVPVEQQTRDHASLLRERVGLALSALSIGRRQAKYPADLVASWASMCNISYVYDKDDSLQLALNKVVDVLRHQYGITVYSFHPNCSPDFNFFDYASPHNQSNSYDGINYYPGTPIFTGRVDTVKHVVTSLTKIRSRISDTGNRYVRLIQMVEEDYRFEGGEIPIDSPQWLNHFHQLVIGQHDGFGIQDIVPLVGRAVSKIKSTYRRPELLTVRRTLRISTQGLQEGPEQWVTIWAIGSGMSQSERRCIAREEINGQIVLLRRAPGSSPWHIEAYLTVTDQQSVSDRS